MLVLTRCLVSLDYALLRVVRLDLLLWIFAIILDVLRLSLFIIAIQDHGDGDGEYEKSLTSDTREILREGGGLVSSLLLVFTTSYILPRYVVGLGSDWRLNFETQSDAAV